MPFCLLKRHEWSCVAQRIFRGLATAGAQAIVDAGQHLRALGAEVVVGAICKETLLVLRRGSILRDLGRTKLHITTLGNSMRLQVGTPLRNAILFALGINVSDVPWEA